ncbi:glyoxylase-like metal-dependent hydrolase (beta-lactamase superfamily II) [Kitasatospora sp. MAA4]|uniref:MBL fold metallo-hydrolase n=1 Tax=Kitasatospora sp. MAA4 TaxID=3035093 RepID=UPI002475C33F|nr:MBL fold metallo-hydrolase [Kitasatospora sp. MAA4]MDH6137097.1 glyoxylase-like metal-dependent hydrolase (beta-lactamase superfamily II) [Kitasatospora sp. MAA4]
MDLVEVLPNLHLLQFEVGQAYLWSDPDALTLIDTGPAGSAPAIAAAVRSLGRRPAEIQRIILTHGHNDHTGGAAEAAAWGEAQVLAGQADAPVIRGELPAPPPVLTEWERELASTIPLPPPTEPVPVDCELVDGDTVEFGDGAQVFAVPGHTDGSIALYLPGPRVLFTGDTIANVGGHTMLGVFNTDRERAAKSLHLQSRLDSDIACFGHGEPIVGGAAERLRRIVG